MSKSMRDLWIHLEQWFQKNAPPIFESLRPGASLRELERAQQQLGVTFPYAVSQFYLRHDGQEPGSPGMYYRERMYSLAEIVQEWQALKDRFDAGEFEGHEAETFDEGELRNTWWSPGWIPLTSGEHDEQLCLDFDPGPEGHEGQMILVSTSCEERCWADRDLYETMLTLYSDLEEGVLEFREHEDEWQLRFSEDASGDLEGQEETFCAGYDLLDEGRYQEAIIAFTEELEDNPHDLGCLENRGYAYERLGEWEKALADYRMAIALDPDDEIAKNNAAWVMSVANIDSLRNGEQAVKWAEEVCELEGWSDPDSLSTLAAAYAESGNFAKAVEVMQQSLAIMEEAQRRIYEPFLEQFAQGQPLRLERSSG